MSERKRLSKEFVFTLISVLGYIFDVYADYFLGITYLLKVSTNQDYVFGILTLFFAAFPALLNGIKVKVNRDKFDILKVYLPQSMCWVFCLLLQGRLALLFAVGRYQLTRMFKSASKQQRNTYESTVDIKTESALIITPDTGKGSTSTPPEEGIPDEELKINELKTDTALTETFIGALPQFIVQMYIVTQVKRVITLLQLVSMVGSICGATYSFASRFHGTPCTLGVIYMTTFLMLFTRVNTLVLSMSLWKWMPLLAGLLHLATVAVVMRCFYVCCCGMLGGDDRRDYNSWVFVLRRWHNVWIPTSTGFTLLFALHMAVQNAVIIFFAAFFFPAENIPENYTHSSAWYDRVLVHLNSVNAGLFILYTWVLLGGLQVVYLLVLLVGRVFRAQFYQQIDEDDFHVARFTC